MQRNFLRRAENKAKINDELKIHHDGSCHADLAVYRGAEHTGLIRNDDKTEKVRGELHDVQHDGIFQQDALFGMESMFVEFQIDVLSVCLQTVFHEK